VPGWFTQQLVHAAAPPHGPGCGLHSLLSAHVVPLNVYPLGHVHVKLPVVLLQVPGPQRVGFVWHSFTSAQVVPLNVYPALQVQV
jgi:hypothetical protein